jgi:hypothetical protein
VVAPIAHHEDVSALMPEHVAYTRRWQGLGVAGGGARARRDTAGGRYGVRKSRRVLHYEHFA